MADGPGHAERRGGLVTGGAVFALPEGARAAPPPSAVRPVPGGPPELLGLALEVGRAVLVWAFDPAPAAWVAVEGTGGPMLLGAAAALASAPPGAPRLVLPSPGAAAPGQRQEAPRAFEPPRAPCPASHATSVATQARPRALALWFGDHAVTVRLAALDGIRPMPAEISPVPGAPACVLGYAMTADGPVLLFDPARHSAEAAEGGARLPQLVAVLRHAGRRIGVPCPRVEPAAVGADIAANLSGTPDGRRALDLAPVARNLPPPPVGVRRSLLLCRSSGLAFAVAAEEVTAVLQPQRPAPAPVGAGAPLRGVCAHHGEVLPVFDAAERLGSASGRTEGESPLLRLALPRPVALAVTQVLGLRSVTADALALVAGDPLVAAFALLDGRPVPVCRAAALAGAPA